MGFASSPETRDTLAGYGIRVGGYRWRWALGLKGGTFPPHYHQNNEFVSDSGEFPALPGEDVNGDTCACNLVPVYRDQSGRFAKPGLEPVFQKPFVASAQLVPAPTVNVEPVDFSPLVAALGEQPPIYVNVTVPDGAIVVTFPDFPTPVVNVAAPDVVVNVDSPTVQVAAPDVQVDVAAPVVNVEPKITVNPTPVQVIKEKVGRAVRFKRNQNGQIESAEVEQ